MLNELQLQLETLGSLKRVEGAVELATVMKAGAAPNLTPAAYVVPLRESPGRNTRVNGPPLQEITEWVAVVTVVKKANDRTGQGANAELQAIRDDIRQVLFGFCPMGYTALELGPSGLLSFENGVLWWQDVFIANRYREAIQP